MILVPLRNTLFSFSSALLCMLPLAAHSATYTHTVVIQGKVAGKQTVVTAPGGKLTVDFSYRDNGRGPDIHEEIVVGRNGQMESYVSTGKSTFGAPIGETYARTGGKAQWKSKADEGGAENVPHAAYLPIETSIEAFAITTRAALAAGGKLASLPSGQLAVNKVADANVTSSSGKKGRVTLYAMTGVSLQPSYIWMWSSAAKPGAEQPRLFGIVSPGFSVTEAGWESNAEALLKIQEEVDNKTLRKLATALSHQVAGATVIRNVRWFDAEAAAMKGPADVHVFRGRIAAVLPANTPLQDAATVIDGTGKTLLPGLFDMHGHTGSWDGVLHVAGGVTTLRDMGNVNDFLLDLRARIDKGEILGPHIVPAGYIEGESPHSSFGGFVVKDVEGAKRAVDWYAQHGYRQIKLYNSIRPEWVEPIAAHAHARGIRVSGHIPAFMRAEEAVRAGFDEIQHINQVILNFLVKKDDDTRTLLRFYLVGDNANQIDLESQQVKDFIKLLVERKVAIDPTMTAFEAMFLQRQGAPNPSFNKVAPNVPSSLSRAWLTNSMDVTDKNAEPFRKSYDKLMRLVKLMHDAGVPLLAGTDDIAGFTLHRELELYVMAGLTPAEVLRIATWNGAKYSQVLERTGTISVGKDADLILVDGDPSVNISDVRKVAMTMKAGVIHFPAEVYEAIGVKPFVAAPKLEKVAAPVKEGVAK